MSALPRAKLTKKKGSQRKHCNPKKWPLGQDVFSAISPDHGALFEKSYGKENMLASMEKNPKNM
ncbi:MAG: hypothetical protein ACLFT5_06780 [Desulfovermiculus sp.]